MDIKRNGSRPSGRGPTENFTGAVRVGPLFEAPEPARACGVSVTFEPGARIAWHTHSLGQTLIVTEPDIADNVRKLYEMAIPADAFARAIAFAMSQPEEVDVNEILFRPTRQEL